MVKETWPDQNPGLFIEVVGTLLAIHQEQGYDAKTLEVLIQQYQSLIGPLPDTTQGSK